MADKPGFESQTSCIISDRARSLSEPQFPLKAPSTGLFKNDGPGLLQHMTGLSRSLVLVCLVLLLSYVDSISQSPMSPSAGGMPEYGVLDHSQLATFPASQAPHGLFFCFPRRKGSLNGKKTEPGPGVRSATLPAIKTGPLGNSSSGQLQACDPGAGQRGP